jgi:UDPglucose--hexose-1-phosphate uridylyltransferase
MPELRKDPVIDRWVIISTERGKRPDVFAAHDMPTVSPEECPFCPGNESHTPPEVLAFRPDGSQPNAPGWTCRVFPNRYPALRVEGELDREGDGMFDRMNGVGAHEVIVETPKHGVELHELEPRRIEDFLWATRSRILDLKQDVRFRYMMVFKNSGRAAGASQEHSHTQLIALPIVPKRVQEELEGSRRYFGYKERCVFCDIIRQERDAGVRVVCENEDFITISPFAPRFPFEMWLMPRVHDALFEDVHEKEFSRLAELLRESLARMSAALNDPAYNFMIHTAPVRNHQDHAESYHWHIEIIPKVTMVAGFEWGTGFYINSVAPEEAAAYLRDVRIEK